MKRAQEGAALISVIVVTMALAAMGVAIVTIGVSRNEEAQEHRHAELAYTAAMTGIDVAIFEMNTGADITGDAAVGTSAGVYEGATYQVRITPAFTGPGVQYTLTASGLYGGVGSGVQCVLRAAETFPYGMFARRGINIGGAFSIDSYDSDAGTYASQFSVDHAGIAGNIGSNGDIHAGGSLVWGDATPGLGQQVTGDPTDVLGSTAPGGSNFTPPEYEYAPAIASSGAYSGSSTLFGGSYRYDSFFLGGSHELVIDGDVELFVDEHFVVAGASTIRIKSGGSLTIRQGEGAFKIAGNGMVNEDQSPDSLTVMSASTTGVMLAGTADFHGLLYAPNAPMEVLGTAHIYGAVMADILRVQGTGMMHFDEALQVPDEIETFLVVSARKIASEL